jgi:hypothetical protein
MCDEDFVGWFEFAPVGLVVEMVPLFVLLFALELELLSIPPQFQME